MIIYKKNKYNTNGFTIIELVVVIAIFSVLVFGVSKMLTDIFKNSSSQLATLSNIDQARAVSSKFVNEIRSATYGSYPLIIAQDNNIKFYSPIGANPGEVNMINYYITDTTLFKDILIPTGSPPTYTLKSHIAVLEEIENGSSPLFYYYDGDYNGIDNIVPLSQPINITQVRFIRMNVIMKNQTTSQSTGTFSLDYGAAIRALKDNLGN
jgi:prepilin-type N-terminal cleavage/methylation domain-containing protein